MDAPSACNARDVRLAGFAQHPEDTQRRIQRLHEKLAARFAECDVEPEEAPLRSQCGDALALGCTEPVEELRHSCAA